MAQLGRPGCAPGQWAKHTHPHVGRVAVGHACGRQVFGMARRRRPGNAVNMGRAHAAPYQHPGAIPQNAARVPDRVSGPTTEPAGSRHPYGRGPGCPRNPEFWAAFLIGSTLEGPRRLISELMGSTLLENIRWSLPVLCNGRCKGLLTATGAPGLF